MKHILIIIILILLSLPLLAAGEWSQYYFRFELQDKTQLTNLTRIISIDNVKDNWVYAYANDWEWAEFNKLGYRAQILPAPSSQYPAIMSSSQSQLRLWDSYPTYDAYVAMMYAFQTNYPNLCQIIDAGTTVGGRKILFAKISDNVATHEKEPEVMYSSSMHGDEITGYVLMLRLIDTMLSQYSTDTRIANLVNNMEIYINPDANPDGTYYGGNSTVSGARRANQNGYDLNRNFPNFDGSTNTGPIQTETTLFMNFANAHRFVLSANFHGGAEVVNYPWDYTYTLHPDNSWWLSTSLVYANSVQAHGPTGYFTDVSANGVTNGAAWYVVAGGRQDWHNYGAHGREVCIEISSTKLPAASTLPSYWNYNYDAFLAYLEQAQYGVYGTVQDINGNPLQASIYAVGIDTSYTYVTTDPLHGDFNRFLSPGNYTLQVSTAGYANKTVNVTVTAGQQTPVTIIFGGIEPPALAFGSMNISDPSPCNANGRLDPGETVTLTMPLNNTGGTASPAGSATLTCSTSGITVNTGTASFAAIAAAGTTSLTFSITAASNIPIGTVASLVFNATAGTYTASKTETAAVGLITETFESGNFTSFPWIQGTTPWVINTTSPHAGTYAAKSGTILGGGSTTMETTRILSASGTLSFWYKTSSESGYDFLKFYIDGTVQNSWSGETAWTQASYTLSVGTHVLKWEYMKDGSVDTGSDCAWVDDIIFPASTAPSSFYPPQNLTALGGNSVVTLTWAAPATGTPTVYKIFKNSSLLTTVTGLNYSDTAVSNGTTYSYYLKAVYSGGESDPTSTVTATPSLTTFVTIGSGTTSNGNTTACPINVYYQSLHGQSVYLASELTAAGVVGPINITQIGFNITGLPTVAMPNFIVRMGHTTSTNVASWIPSSSMSTVYTTTSYLPTATGWNMLTLSTPFLWNGTSNIVVDTAFGLIGSYAQTGTTQYSTVTSGYRYVRSDTVDERTIFTGGSTGTNRSNIKFGLVPNSTGPLMTVTPTTLTYGNVAVGANSVQQFTIQNTGDQTLTGSITTPAGYTVADVVRNSGLSESELKTVKVARNTISFSIIAGATKTYTVTFAPTAATAYSGSVAITSNAATNPNVNISVSGTGYIPPTISLDNNSITLTRYTNQTGTANFTISNSGTQNLTYTVSESPAVTWYSAAPASGTVAGSGSQLITGTFTSAGLAPGVYTTTLNVTSNDTVHPTLPVAVQFTVSNTLPTIDVPALTEFDENASATLDFTPYVNDIDAQTLTLGYSGNTNIQVQITGFSVQFSAPVDWIGEEVITFSVFDGTDYAYDTMTVKVNIVYLPEPPITTVIETENGVSMGWTPVPNAQYYKIYRAFDPYGTFEFVGTTTSTNFEDWGVNPQAFYKIVAVYEGAKK